MRIVKDYGVTEKVGKPQKNGYYGCGCPCSSTNAVFHTEKEAILYCIDKLKLKLAFDKEAVAKLEEIKARQIFVQQSLF